MSNGSFNDSSVQSSDGNAWVPSSWHFQRLSSYSLEGKDFNSYAEFNSSMVEQFSATHRPFRDSDSSRFGPNKCEEL